MKCPFARPHYVRAVCRSFDGPAHIKTKKLSSMNLWDTRFQSATDNNIADHAGTIHKFFHTYILL